LAVDAKEPSRLYLATHNGFFVLTADGRATRLSDIGDDFMGFTLHPTDPTIFSASGHPAGGGNLGFLASTDAGKSWRQVAPGADGPVDFHQMDVSRADPRSIFGIYGGNVQTTKDGGQSWKLTGRAPDGIIDLAASARHPDWLYAATQTGLLSSHDGGLSWHTASFPQRAVTLVKTSSDGSIFAFVVGTGLVRATEERLDWTDVGRGFGGQFLIHLAIDPSNADRLYGVTFDPTNHRSTVLGSRDGGRSCSDLANSRQIQ
jgi:photosystem II stability/assembly factor-like uncharacterized protein